MKLKHVIYAVFALAIVFVSVAGYLVYSERSGPEVSSVSGSVLGTQTGAPSPIIPDRAKPVSGKGGKLIIAYSGDMRGSLDPCG